MENIPSAQEHYNLISKNLGRHSIVELAHIFDLYTMTGSVGLTNVNVPAEKKCCYSGPLIHSFQNSENDEVSKFS